MKSLQIQRNAHCEHYSATCCKMSEHFKGSKNFAKPDQTFLHKKELISMFSGALEHSRGLTLVLLTAS